VTEFSPSQIRVGKETSVPPPATELMAPAKNAAANAAAPVSRVKWDTNYQVTRSAHTDSHTHQQLELVRIGVQDIRFARDLPANACTAARA